MDLFIDILNYALRIGIIVLGVMIAGGYVMQIPGDEAYSKGTGVLLIVFGVYRIILYFFGVRRRNAEAQEGGNDDAE